MITLVDSVAVTIKGNDAPSIVSSSSSSNSTMSSMANGTVNGKIVIPTGIVTLYGPGS